MLISKNTKGLSLATDFVVKMRSDVFVPHLLEGKCLIYLRRLY